MAKESQIQLTFDQLYQAYDKSLDNSMRLHGAGVNLLQEFPDISLGLFELGQEELGKSYTCLATMAVKKHAVDWTGFWRNWKRHNIKAGRAFYYEWLYPDFRLAFISSSDGSKMTGFPLRSEIAHEKEFSFYVNYDPDQKKFISPLESVSRVETFNRACAITGLIEIALAVKETLDVGEKERNYRTFSIIPFRILTKFIYQQDVPELYCKFSAISPYHRSLISEMKKAFNKSRSELKNILKKLRKNTRGVGLNS
jgi:AbiV family abortive infection protein